MFKIEIPFTPQSASRARASKKTKNNKKVTTESKYREYKQRLISEFNKYSENPNFIKTFRNFKYGLSISIVYKFDKKGSDRPFYNNRPDIDNLVKASVDGLFQSKINMYTRENGKEAQYVDDCNVVHMLLMKIRVPEEDVGQTIVIRQMLEEEMEQISNRKSFYTINIPIEPKSAFRSRPNPFTRRMYTDPKYFSYKTKMKKEISKYSEDDDLKEIMTHFKYGLDLSIVYKFDKKNSKKPFYNNRPDLDNLAKASIDSLFESDVNTYFDHYKEGPGGSKIEVHKQKKDDCNIVKLELLKIRSDKNEVGQTIKIGKALEE